MYCIYVDVHVFESICSNELISRVSCQKGPTRHACAWQIGPFWQDTLDIEDVLIIALDTAE